MSVVLLGVLEILGALVWLALLVVTQFNVVTISMGLLGMVYLMSRSGPNRAH